MMAECETKSDSNWLPEALLGSWGNGHSDCEQSRSSFCLLTAGQKIRWAIRTCMLLIVAPKASTTKTEFRRISSLVADHISKLSEDWSLWQGSQPARNMAALSRHQASRVILLSRGTQRGHVLPVAFGLITSPPWIFIAQTAIYGCCRSCSRTSGADKSQWRCLVFKTFTRGSLFSLLVPSVLFVVRLSVRAFGSSQSVNSLRSHR